MDASWIKQAGDGNSSDGSDRDTLISLVNDVKRMIESKNGAALSAAFELLETWLLAHFADEEKKARAANIDFPSRKFERQYELNGLFFLRGQLLAKNGAWSDDEAKYDIQFLSDWLIEHIANEDMQKCKFQTSGNRQSAGVDKEILTQGV
jgi:hemerythrin